MAFRLNLDYQAGGYLKNQVVSRYFFHSGKLTIPVMGSPVYPATEDTTVSVQLHSPVSYKEVTFFIARFGQQPKLPTPYVSDTNLEFLGGSITTPAPLILTDGETLLWQVSGYYFYRCKRPVWTTEGFDAGKQTIDNAADGQNLIKSVAFTPTAVVANPTLETALQNILNNTKPR